MCDIFSSKNAKRRMKIKEGEPPPKLISQGDILIKQLSEKQLSKKTTLKKELCTQQQFQKSTEYPVLSNLTAGSSSLADFELVVEKCKEVECLKSKGLSNFDIQLYLDYKSNSLNKLIKTRYKNIEETVLNNKIKSILTIVKNENSNSSCEILEDENLGISRHEIDYLRSVKPNCIENRLFQFAINNQPKKQLISKNIDHINEIEKELVQDLNTFQSVDTKQIQKRARKLGRQIEELNKKQINLTNSESQQLYKKPNQFTNNSKWDVQEIIEECEVPIKEQKLYQCKELNFYTIKNGEIVKLERNRKSSYQKTDAIKLPKLSVEEIKAIERFNNYQPGIPTNNLYLKNLSNKITENDLSDIFKKYKSEIMNIKLLKGKMRGQAFIKFNSVQTASKALEEINGTVFKNKPIIVQFGKSLNV